MVEEAAKAGFVAPAGFDELERRVYDDTVLILLANDRVVARMLAKRDRSGARPDSDSLRSIRLGVQLNRRDAGRLDGRAPFLELVHDQPREESGLRSAGGGTNRPSSSMRLRTAGVSSVSPVAALSRRMIAGRRLLGEEEAVPAVGVDVGEALLERGRQVRQHR